jgi:hypothetical protein
VAFLFRMTFISLFMCLIALNPMVKSSRER